MSKSETPAQAGLGLPNLDRRDVFAHLGAGLVAGAALAVASASAAAPEEASPELLRLIAAHRAALEAQLLAEARQDEAQKRYKPWTLPSFKGLQFTSVQLADLNLDECKDHLFQCMEFRKRPFDELARASSPQVAEQIKAAFDAVFAERLSMIDKLFAEREAMKEACGKTAADREAKETFEAQEAALLALCAYPCATIENIRTKAEYLATADNWLDNPHMEVVFGAFAGGKA